MIRIALAAVTVLLAPVAMTSARQDPKLAELRHVIERRLDTIATSLDGVFGYTSSI